MCHHLKNNLTVSEPKIGIISPRVLEFACAWRLKTQVAHWSCQSSAPGFHIEFRKVVQFYSPFSYVHSRSCRRVRGDKKWLTWAENPWSHSWSTERIVEKEVLCASIGLAAWEPRMGLDRTEEGHRSLNLEGWNNLRGWYLVTNTSGRTHVCRK